MHKLDVHICMHMDPYPYLDSKRLVRKTKLLGVTACTHTHYRSRWH